GATRVERAIANQHVAAIDRVVVRGGVDPERAGIADRSADVRGKEKIERGTAIRHDLARERASLQSGQHVLRPVAVDAIVVDVVAGEGLVEAGSEGVGIVQSFAHRHGAAEQYHVRVGRIVHLLHRTASERVGAIRDVVAYRSVCRVLDYPHRPIGRKNVPVFGCRLDQRRFLSRPGAELGARPADVPPRQQLGERDGSDNRSEQPKEAPDARGEPFTMPTHRGWTSTCALTIARDIPRWTSMLTFLSVLLAGTGCAVSLRSTSVPVLVYHRIGADRHRADPEWVPLDTFGEQMRYLAEHGYSTLSLSDLVRFVRGGAAPPKAICITFDDGWRSQLLAVPVLHRYGLKAHFLLVPERGIEDPNGDYLRWDEARELAHDQAFEIGAHSMTHPWDRASNLVTWANGSVPGRGMSHVRHEVEDSKRVLEQALAIPVTIF